MDQQLAKRLNELNDQNLRLEKVENEFLYLDAHRKVLFSQLLLKTDGSNKEIREAQVYVDQAWKDFIAGLVDIESTKNKERRRFDILMNAFIAELNTFKREGSLISKEGYS